MPTSDTCPLSYLWITLLRVISSRYASAFLQLPRSSDCMFRFLSGLKRDSAPALSERLIDRRVSSSLQDREQLVQLCNDLGIAISINKSNLELTSKNQYLWMRIVIILEGLPNKLSDFRISCSPNSYCKDVAAVNKATWCP